MTAEGTSTPVTSSLLAIGVDASAAVFGGTGFTQPDGSYEIHVAAPATFTVEVFPVDMVHAPQFAFDKTDEGIAIRLPVTDGETLDHVDFHVKVGGTIDGTVTEENGGDPFPGVHVIATLIGTLPHVVSATTDAAGKYHIAGLAFTDYEVRFTPPASAGFFLSEVWDEKTASPGDPVTVTETPVTGIDASLGDGGAIEGTITGLFNQPMNGVPVRALPPPPPPLVAGQALVTQPYDLGHTTTDLSGHYTIVVPSGTYKVLATANSSGLMSEFFDNEFTQASADDVVVTAPNATTGKNIKFDASAKITGKVTDATTHQPIQSAIVTAIEPNGVPNASGAVAVTDSQGNYLLQTNLHTGDYTVAFFAGGYDAEFYNDETTLQAADPVHVTAPDTTPSIDAELAACTPAESTTTTTSTSIEHTTSTSTTPTTLPVVTTLPSVSSTVSSTVSSSTSSSLLAVTTTTLLAGGGACGDPAAPHPNTTASDALAVLKAAVGSAICEPCKCDVNNSGTVTASDALTVLRKAVGQAVTLTCPECPK